MLKGFRTIIVNALLAGSVPVLDSLASVNWVELLGPTGAMVAVAAINIVMRMITTTPVGQSE
jgi:hypothetical protein